MLAQKREQWITFLNEFILLWLTKLEVFHINWEMAKDESKIYKYMHE